MINVNKIKRWRWRQEAHEAQRVQSLKANITLRAQRYFLSSKIYFLPAVCFSVNEFGCNEIIISFRATPSPLYLSSPDWCWSTQHLKQSVILFVMWSWLRVERVRYKDKHKTSWWFKSPVVGMISLNIFTWSLTCWSHHVHWLKISLEWANHRLTDIPVEYL